MRVAACVLGTLVMLGACATAPSGESAAAKENKVCKNIRTTGSNMPTQVCRSQEEWDAYKKQGQDSVDEFERQRDGVISPNS